MREIWPKIKAEVAAVVCSYFLNRSRWRPVKRKDESRCELPVT